MPDWLMSVPAFIVAIGVLVAVHEFGHFWVARRLGVQVLRYSVGFGPRLLGRTGRDGTEYWLSAIPLGGYVKMLDEREGEVPADQAHRAFNRQPVASRIAIVAAGPGINFLFAIAAYWLVFMLGVGGIKPVIGEVPAETRAAAAGLEQRDQVVAVDDRSTPTWQELRLTLLQRTLDGDMVSLTVNAADGGQRRVMLDLSGVSAEPETLFTELGMQPFQPGGVPVIADVLDGSAAAAAGMQAGDRVLAAGDESLDGPQALVDWVQARPGETIELKIERNGQPMTLSITLARADGEDGPVGRLGAQISVDASQWEDLRTVTRLDPLSAIPAAVAETWSITALTVRLLWRMVIGDVSWKNISGPIQIADYAGKTATIGLEAFLGFLALVSVSLAVLNLLPVPVLDGGHLMYYAVEIIRGRPLSEHAQIIGQQAGMLALLMLMSLAFYNDIMRLLG